MPLIRKPKDSPAIQNPIAGDILTSLADPDTDRRWAAARDATRFVGGVAALAAALRTETDSRVREAMFTSLARIGSTEAANALISMLRSDDANLRTGALDTLRIMVSQVRDLLPGLLTDQDVDIRILSCELARSLPSGDATRLMCGVLDHESEANVCAAAVDVLTETGGAEALASLHGCALRFRDSAFLVFAIKVVTDRIAAQSAPSRA